MKYSLLVFALFSLCAYSAHGSRISQKDKLLAGTIFVDTTVLVRGKNQYKLRKWKKLCLALIILIFLLRQENEVPQSQQLSVKQEAFLTVLDGIVSLNEVKTKVQSSAHYFSGQYLNGLAVLLSEVISDGCAWVRRFLRQ